MFIRIFKSFLVKNPIFRKIRLTSFGFATIHNIHVRIYIYINVKKTYSYSINIFLKFLVIYFLLKLALSIGWTNFSASLPSEFFNSCLSLQFETILIENKSKIKSHYSIRSKKIFYSLNVGQSKFDWIVISDTFFTVKSVIFDG